MCNRCVKVIYSLRLGLGRVRRGKSWIIHPLGLDALRVALSSIRRKNDPGWSLFFALQCYSDSWLRGAVAREERTPLEHSLYATFVPHCEGGGAAARVGDAHNAMRARLMGRSRKGRGRGGGRHHTVALL